MIKTLHFKTEEDFDRWVSYGNELYAVYRNDGRFLCDVEEPLFIEMLNRNVINADTMLLTGVFTPEQEETIKEVLGVKVIIGE